MGEPLLMSLVVTTAVRFPAAGLGDKLTVSEVADADVTVPIAPLLKTTVLFNAVESKPAPVMVISFVVKARLATLRVTPGITLATCSPIVPLDLLLVVTIAVKLPRSVGAVDNVMVSDVAVAAVTAPTASLLKVTVLLPGVVSNPKPWIMIIGAFAAKLSVLLVTTGLTVATWMVELLVPSITTDAVRSPAVGLVVKVTVSVVAVAAVTAPIAPLLKTTELLPGVVSKPKPLMLSVAVLPSRFVVLDVMTGTTVAIRTASPLE